MRLLPMLSALAGLAAVAACENSGQLPQDPSPYAGPVEQYSQPTDGMQNEIGDNGL